MSRLADAHLAVVLWFAAAACGGVTPAGPATAEEGCAQEATAICDALDGCAAFLDKLFYGDKATCVARLSLSCTNDQNVSGTNRTLGDLGDCATAVATTSCADLVASKFPNVCQTKPGMLVNGMGCGSDWQCQSTYCAKQGQCGVCAPRAAAAGDCTVTAGCQSGLVCANQKCVAPADPGALCDPTNQPCRGDLYCNAAHACASKVGVGGSCADTGDACDITQGAACNPFTHKCDAIAVAAAGEACGIVSGTLTLCVGFNPCPSGSCVMPAGDGEACGTAANGSNCVPPAVCDAGVCRLPSALTCH